MYCYFPLKWYGNDKVAWVTGVSGKKGDLYAINGDFALLLGESVSLSETISGHETATMVEQCFACLCSPRTVDRMMSCVQERYSTYAQIFPLRLGNDMSVLVKNVKKKYLPAERTWEISLGKAGDFGFTQTHASLKQQLLVFPDLWTMHQKLPQKLFGQPGVARWHSGLTTRQQLLIYLGCKFGQIHTLITTPAGIFQDRLALGDIFLVDGHKRRYKAQQDPRYWIPSVLGEMQQTYGGNLTKSGYFLEQ